MFDRINGIYMIYLLFLYPDHSVYPVEKKDSYGELYDAGRISGNN